MDLFRKACSIFYHVRSKITHDNTNDDDDGVNAVLGNQSLPDSTCRAMVAPDPINVDLKDKMIATYFDSKKKKDRFGREGEGEWSHCRGYVNSHLLDPFKQLEHSFHQSHFSLSNMGNLHSNSKLLGDDQGDDERLLKKSPQQKRLSKIFTFFHMIGKAAKGLFQKARSIFYLHVRSTTSHDNIDDDGINAVSCNQSLPDSTSRAIVAPDSINVDLKDNVVVDEGIWIKHYNSRHRILLVGEGDFSFSASLARAFGHASKMIATSFDSKTFLKKNYSYAWSNILELTNMGCKVMHWIDATEMANDEYLRVFKYDRIIFNFPYAGYFKDLSRDFQLRRHRRLVSMFLKNAKGMLSENGEIHITHKTNGFNLEWKIESMAFSHGLMLVEAVDFDRLHYPGYNNKRGFGGDESFNCDPSKTYKFGLKS